MMQTQVTPLSVTDLNKQIRNILEHQVGPVTVLGEISNLSKPSSGHYYFTLKDSSAQIRAVFFKNSHTIASRAVLDNGNLVIAAGRLTVYEPRGDYQIIIDSVTEAGLGTLHQQFEALKKRLAQEGLFDILRKKPLPAIPETIGIISSPSGAAVFDICSTLKRRFPYAKVLVYPTEVQGVNAPYQIIQALQKAVTEGRADVLILARGGGSIEDLWAFNDEGLARAIAACSIPLISGVGHETDFTICDFVADHRAPTPTGAAEASVPHWQDLLTNISHAGNRLVQAMARIMENHRLHLKLRLASLSSPKKTIEGQWQTLDYLSLRLNHYMRQRLLNADKKLSPVNQQLTRLIHGIVLNNKASLHSRVSTLDALSPLATLARGYAIATANKVIITNSHQVEIGEKIEVRLNQGSIGCEVSRIME